MKENNEKMSSAMIYDFIYPVGSIFMSVVEMNPATIFGGEWEAFAAGKTLVGIDKMQKEFDAAEKIGGEKEHVLSIEEMPSHAHGTFYQDIGGSGAVARLTADGSTTTTTKTGGDRAHNNLQPYTVVYMWKRVA